MWVTWHLCEWLLLWVMLQLLCILIPTKYNIYVFSKMRCHGSSQYPPMWEWSPLSRNHWGSKKYRTAPAWYVLVLHKHLGMFLSWSHISHHLNRPNHCQLSINFYYTCSHIKSYQPDNTPNQPRPTYSTFGQTAQNCIVLKRTIRTSQ